MQIQLHQIDTFCASAVSGRSLSSCLLDLASKVILTPVELPQVLLLLLVHHDVDPGDGLADHADLG